MLTKNQAIEALVSRTGLSEEGVRDFFENLHKAVLHSTWTHGRAVVPGLGTIVLRKKLARKGVHPKTKAPTLVPAHNTLSLTVAKTLKEELNL